ncbi:hypothetical protein IPZ58_00530 [Streptomyces roseoverticillatus]|uniref:hypothetical protein n=1 Tax=Streptomyces roseoverticillatus TaxID=66429 RepID=UPI001F2045AF|nr:hypothetical protein [Streptomyces roseoverticillatus]MCF3100076.1 hypothetical protein [Streptomyces roseoverticillatus]
MPVVTDLDSVPLTPVYTIVISAAGEATIEGEPVEPLPGQDGRTSALAEIRVRAAKRGHPIRINAKEPDGSVWPLIVDHDGAVTPLPAPHPTPPPAPVPAAPVFPVAPVAPQPVPVAVPPAPVPAASVPAPVVPAPAPVAPPAPVPAPPAPAPTPVSDWSSALPPHHAERFGRIVAAELRGDLAGAALAARELEGALDREYGALHPHTVGVLGTRAWLALLLQEDWAAIMRLHLRTAERRHNAQAPVDETRRVLRNARAVWWRLAAVDRAEADEIQPELQRVSDLVEGVLPE